jgi:hypothetical protein
MVWAATKQQAACILTRYGREDHIMLRTIFCMVIMAAAAAGGVRWTAGLENEQAAPPDRFVVTTNAGMRLIGAAAKVEIKYLDAAKAPAVEVVLSASDRLGRTWALLSTASSDFLETLTLSASVIARPLQSGNVSVQVNFLGADASFAPSGLLHLRLQAGRLVGETSGMSDDFAAKFEGPFVVTCAVPADFMGAGAPTPTSENVLPLLIVDEKFESALCRRYIALAGQPR